MKINVTNNDGLVTFRFPSLNRHARREAQSMYAAKERELHALYRQLNARFKNDKKALYGLLLEVSDLSDLSRLNLTLMGDEEDPVLFEKCLAIARWNDRNDGLMCEYLRDIKRVLATTNKE